MPTDHAAEATAVRQAWGQRGAAVCLQVACLGEHAGAHAHWHRGGVGGTYINDPLMPFNIQVILMTH